MNIDQIENTDVERMSLADAVAVVLYGANMGRPRTDYGNRVWDAAWATMKARAEELFARQAQDREDKV